MAKSKLKNKIKELPRQPGIYEFKNSGGKAIYIGKAKNLRSRVGSYFQKNLDPNSKTTALVKSINDVEIIETMSELEALILEAELIKKHKPRYNIVLKDDKSYLYIVIRREKVELDNKKIALGVSTIPKVLAVRETDLQKNDITFGPYPDSGTTKYVVRTIRKALPYRDCSISKFNKYKKLCQPCLFGHIGLCQAPCIGRTSPEKYRREIKRIQKLLSGESASLLRSLESAMRRASKSESFEEAAKIRDTLQKFEYVRAKSIIAKKYIDNPYLVQDLRAKSIQELFDNIPVLSASPSRIECYDISNISGKDSVGSMVVAHDGEIVKREYRKFKIKRKNTSDDVAMIAEIIQRRLKNDWDVPDLIVVDGGKGQVSAALTVLEKSNVRIPVVGLAKKLEAIIYFDNGKFKEVILPRDNEGLKLLQRLRDEAHRFAQSYHHKLRLKKIKA